MTAPRALSAEERARIARDYGCASVPATVTVVPRGVSAFTAENPEVVGWRQQRDIKFKRRGPPLDPEVAARRDRVAAAHARGLTVPEIMAGLGLSEHIVRMDLVKRYLKPHPARRAAAQTITVQKPKEVKAPGSRSDIRGGPANGARSSSTSRRR